MDIKLKELQDNLCAGTEVSKATETAQSGLYAGACEALLKAQNYFPDRWIIFRVVLAVGM